MVHSFNVLELGDGYELIQIGLAIGCKNYLYLNGECISTFFVGEGVSMPENELLN